VLQTDGGVFLLLQQRSKHPREMIITPKASASHFAFSTLPLEDNKKDEFFALAFTREKRNTGMRHMHPQLAQREHASLKQGNKQGCVRVEGALCA